MTKAKRKKVKKEVELWMAASNSGLPIVYFFLDEPNYFEGVYQSQAGTAGYLDLSALKKLGIKKGQKKKVKLVVIE